MGYDIITLLDLWIIVNLEILKAEAYVRAENSANQAIPVKS